MHGWFEQLESCNLLSLLLLLTLILQPGFYDISAGCLPCQCNQGGSLSQICDQSSNNAQCPCIPNVELTTCHRPAAEYYSKTLDDIIFEAEAASSTEVCLKELLL